MLIADLIIPRRESNQIHRIHGRAPFRHFTNRIGQQIVC